MNSSALNPFRWYDKPYKQNRYDNNCSDSCEFKLITDQGHLLPFQFTREASGYAIDNWILRQACVNAELSTDSSDIELNKLLVQLFNTGATDYFIYTGSILGISIPPGDYFSIIKCGNEIYYSEVITIKSFTPGKCNYYMLQWYNSCDIQGVIYSTSFKNKLYLEDAALSKPEYPFTEEGETDGNKNFIAKYQKWEKQVQFIVTKVPEYISDSLTNLRLHDTINITPPLRIEQIQLTDSIDIQSVEYEVSYVVNDCFQNVVLNLILENKYIESACCNDNFLTPCEVEEEGIPSALLSWSAGAFHFYGSAYSNSYIQAEYSNDGGLTWLKDSQIIESSDYNGSGLHIIYPEKYDGSTIIFRIHNYTLNCEYGYTDDMTYTFPGECEVRTIDSGVGRTLSDGTFRTLSPC